MSLDMRIDSSTGDLMTTPSNDVALVAGVDEVAQRVWTHLRIGLGSYGLEPLLGSTLVQLTRLPVNVAVAQLPLNVKEALAQMDDIVVQEVTAAVDPNSASTINFEVVYAVSLDGSVGQSDNFTGSITVGA